MAETTVLNHVNVPPAQTWNYLKINELSLEVPAVPSTSPAWAPEPLLDGIEMGAGDEASTWVRNAASERAVAIVPAATEGRVVVEQDGSRRGIVQDVIVEDGASAQVVVVATGTHAHGTHLRVHVGRGAHAEVSLFVAIDNAATYIDTSGYTLQDGASLEIRHHVLTCGTTALGTCIGCDGTSSTASLVCRNLVGSDQLLDMNYLVRQRGRLSHSVIDVSGVLGEGGSKNLCDTIDLIHGCKGASGLENETVLLAGEHVVNKSLPTILCDEDDVAGNHGATIGSIAPEQLEYLAERGLTPSEVTELFQRSVIEDALTHAHALSCEPAVAAALAAAEGVLGPEVAAELQELHASA